MDSVYKVCFYGGTGEISHIYVFCGDEHKPANEFFSRSEYNELVSKKVIILYVLHF